MVLWRHRGRVLRCSTEAQDKGRFAYVQCKFTCSESILKYTAPTLPKSQWGPTLHLLPLRSTGTGDSSMQEHQVQRGVNWMEPKAGWEKKICFRKISQQLSVNLFRDFATSGAVTPALVPVPNCPLCCPTPRERNSIQCKRHLPGKQASTGASARGISDTLALAPYFPMRLNFISKMKAILFRALHS